MAVKRGHLAIDNDSSTTGGGDDVDTEHDRAKRLKTETAKRIGELNTKHKM